MDRASFYTNASSSTEGARPFRVPSSAYDDRSPRGYPNDSVSGRPSLPPRAEILEAHRGNKPLLPPVFPREREAPPYERYPRPIVRPAWDHPTWDGPRPRANAGLTASASSQHIGRTPSPPRMLLPTRNVVAGVHDRADFAASIYPPSLAERELQPSRFLPFEESAMAAPIKRPRVSLACLACRNRKSRCDGNRPTCKTCAHMKIECKWPEVDFRRAKSGDVAGQRRKSGGAGGYDRSPGRSEQMRFDRETRGLGSPSARYLLPHASSSESQSLHRLAGLGSADRAPTSSSYRFDSEEDGYVRPARVSPPRLPRVPSHWSSTPISVSGAAEKPSEAHLADRTSASRVRDVAAGIMASLQLDPRLDRQVRPAAEAPRAIAVASPSRLEADRLDEVYAADWARLGVSRADLTRSFTDAMAGVLGYLHITDPSFVGKRPDAFERTRLHLFRLSDAAASPQLEVQHLIVPLDLTDQQRQRLLRASNSGTLTLRDLDLDLRRCARLTSSSSDDANSALLAGDAGSEGGLPPRYSEPLNEASNEILFELFDGDMPRAEILQSILEDTAELFGSIYVFLDARAIVQKARDRTASPVLLNAMCGLGCRFARRSLVDFASATECAESFNRKAHQLFWQSVTNPSPDAAAAGILIVVSEIGSNRTSSASTFVAATSRMAIDLGLHRRPNPGSNLSDEELQVQEFLFWSIYILDRVVSLYNRRPFSLKDSDIDVNLPSPSGGSRNAMFGHIVSMLRMHGKVSETLFSPVPVPSATGVEQVQAEQLAALEAALTRWYASLPPWLHFNAENLAKASEKSEGAFFCVLHLAYHATFIWRYILATSIPMDLRDLEQMRHSTRSIVDIIELTDRQDSFALIGPPSITSSFFMAGCICMAELEQMGPCEVRSPASPGRGPVAEDFDAAGRLRSALQTCLSKLGKRAEHWPDARVCVEILRNRLVAHESPPVAQSTTLALLDQLVSRLGLDEFWPCVAKQAVDAHAVETTSVVFGHRQRFLKVTTDGSLPVPSELVEEGAVGTRVHAIKDASQFSAFLPALV